MAKTPEKKAKENPAVRRRAYILDCLEHQGVVSLDQIKAKGKRPVYEGGGFSANSASIALDIAVLNYLLKQNFVKVGDDAKNPEWINEAQPKATQSAKHARLKMNEVAKVGIAWTLGCIVLGGRREGVFASPGAKAHSTPATSWKRKLVAPEVILKQLKDQQRSEVMRKLESYWEQHARRISLDTGSTVDIFVREVLGKIDEMPFPDINLNYLEVLTNSRSVFYELGQPEVRVRTLVIGGGMEVKTEAVCGHLAEMFVEQSSLTFGVAVVGATVVDLKRERFGSDYFRDGKIKSMLLQRAALKVVVADASKFLDEPSKAYDPFAKLHSEEVDMIVTDNLEHLPVARREVIRCRLGEAKIALIEVPTATQNAAKTYVETLVAARKTINNGK